MSNYLQVAFIFGVQTLYSINRLKSVNPENKCYLYIVWCWNSNTTYLFFQSFYRNDVSLFELYSRSKIFARIMSLCTKLHSILRDWGHFLRSIFPLHLKQNILSSRIAHSQYKIKQLGMARSKLTYQKMMLILKNFIKVTYQNCLQGISLLVNYKS